MVFHLKFECRFFLENPTYSGVIWTLYIFTVCWCADLCENSETFIMSSNRVVDVMEDPGYTHSARRPKSVATKTSCPWISEIGEPFRTRVSVDVGCVLIFFSQIFDPVKAARVVKHILYDILGCMFSAKVDKYLLLTMSCKEKLYLRKKKKHSLSRLSLTKPDFQQPCQRCRQQKGCPL